MSASVTCVKISIRIFVCEVLYIMWLLVLFRFVKDRITIVKGSVKQIYDSELVLRYVSERKTHLYSLIGLKTTVIWDGK
jgi:hypothetical protein